MRESLDRLWRTGATAWCFACFGLGGLLLRLVVFPLLGMVVRRAPRRAAAARAMVHHSFRGFISMMRALGVITYELHGTDKLRRHGLLILANHPSLIDVVFLMALIKRADCIVKATLVRNPFTRGPVRAAGLVCNDAGCTMNIAGMCHRRGVDVKVKHIAELMADAMGIDVTAW